MPTDSNQVPSEVPVWKPTGWTALLFPPDWPPLERFFVAIALLFVAQLPIPVAFGAVLRGALSEDQYFWEAADFAKWMFPVMAGVLGWSAILLGRWAGKSSHNIYTFALLIFVGGISACFQWLAAQLFLPTGDLEALVVSLMMSLGFWSYMIDAGLDGHAEFVAGWIALPCAMVVAWLVSRRLSSAYPRWHIALAMLGWPIAGLLWASGDALGMG